MTCGLRAGRQRGRHDYRFTFRYGTSPFNYRGGVALIGVTRHGEPEGGAARETALQHQPDGDQAIDGR